MWHIQFTGTLGLNGSSFTRTYPMIQDAKIYIRTFIRFMFELVRYVPIDSFSVKLGRVLGRTSIKHKIKCLAFLYNTVPASRKRPIDLNRAH